jgi:hypothetical protein
MLRLSHLNTVCRCLLLFLVGAVILGAWGCGSKPQFGDKKEDWARTKPPPGWHPPSQAGVPAAGPPGTASNAPAPQGNASASAPGSWIKK